MSFKAPAPPKPNRSQPPALDRDAPATQRARNRKPGELPLVAKILISLLVVWHLTAVFLAPLSIPPSSPLVVDLAQGTFMQKYLDALFLNQGYGFFAPNPGAGHLIRYELFDDHGALLRRGEFPSKEENWPRLLYHRYFMLADQCDSAASGARNEAEVNQWVQKFLAAYANQLLADNDRATTVRVQRLIHEPVSLPDAQNGKTLTDPSTYHVQAEVVQHRQDVSLPPPNQNGAWNQNWRQDVARGWQGGVR